jgi:hypothetical protein
VKVTRTPARIFFEEKDEMFTPKKNFKKPNNSSRIRRFTRRGAIHLQAKFASANLMRSKKFLGILFF